MGRGRPPGWRRGGGQNTPRGRGPPTPPAPPSARGRLPADEAVGYILQACVAMDEAHRRGTVHRDLKPSNVFLCNAGDGSTRTVKVLDFGISKVLEQGPVPVVTTLLSVMGTPQY